MRLVARAGGRTEQISVERRDGGYLVTVGEGAEARALAVDARAIGPFVRSLVVAGESHETAVFRGAGGSYVVGWRGRSFEVELVDPLTHLAEAARGEGPKSGKKILTAYMPGRVVAVRIGVGDLVTEGQPLVVLEAMKMQNEIQADRAGTIARIHVVDGQPVEGGDPLLEIE